MNSLVRSLRRAPVAFRAGQRQSSANPWTTGDNNLPPIINQNSARVHYRRDCYLA